MVLLHAGAGPMDPTRAGVAAAVAKLRAIGRQAHRLLAGGGDAASVASFCCRQMEREPRFNAGIGSALQADGVARLSAALMDGRRQTFSGVVNASYLSHPSELALALQRRRARVIASPAVELLARQLGMPLSANLTERRVRRWVSALKGKQFHAFAGEQRGGAVPPADTVGCLVRNAAGRLVAASSTGGRGFEFPGRVSDSCTVAGTYASKYAAVAATGVGEQIVDDALASRLEARVRDGMSLADASGRCFREAVRRKRAYGWVALSPRQWSVAHTTAAMPYVVIGGRGTRSAVLSSSLDHI